MPVTSFSLVTPDVREELREFVESNPEVLEHLFGKCGCVYFKFRPEDEYEYLVAHTDTGSSRLDSVRDDWFSDTNFGYWWRYNTDSTDTVAVCGWDCGMDAINQSIQDNLLLDDELKAFVQAVYQRQKEEEQEETYSFQMLPLADLVALVEVIQTNLVLIQQAKDGTLPEGATPLSVQEIARITQLVFMNLVLFPARDALAANLGFDPFDSENSTPVMGQMKASVLEALQNRQPDTVRASEDAEATHNPKLSAFKNFVENHLFGDEETSPTNDDSFSDSFSSDDPRTGTSDDESEE